MQALKQMGLQMLIKWVSLKGKLCLHVLHSLILVMDNYPKPWTWAMSFY